MVFTRQRYFAIECKNLYGNIQVDAQGNFIRYLGGGRREGIYSPITQSRRHLELIRAIRRDNHGVAFNLIADRTFDDRFRSLVVLANPKTVLNDRYAPKDVKAQIIRADQLIATIQSINDQPGVGHSKMSFSDMRKAGEGMLSLNAENPVDYVEKFRKMAEEHAKEQAAAPPAAAPATAQVWPGVCPYCGSPLAAHRQTRRASGQEVLRLQLLPALPFHTERRLATHHADMKRPAGAGLHVSARCARRASAWCGCTSRRRALPFRRRARCIWAWRQAWLLRRCGATPARSSASFCCWTCVPPPLARVRYVHSIANGFGQL